jgi:two-component system, OmpR family, phosphate regulon sensor histidine kinase PhoR
MKFGSPIFRKYFWSAFLPAAIAILLVDGLFLGGVTLRVHLQILGALAIAFALAFVAAWLGSRSLVRRILRLQALAENPAGSPPPAGKPLTGEQDEIGALAGVLSRNARRSLELMDRLRLESAQREAILASMVEGVLAVDNDLRVIFCNDSLARLVGAQLPLPPRLPLAELVRDPGLREMLIRTLTSRSPSKETLQLTAADGRVFEVNAAALAATPHQGAMAILHDITDLERLERVRKDFVANVSHELRTPLTAIRGYTEALLDGAAEDAASRSKFLSVILTHATRLNSIASDLLILSELESARAQPEPERISLPAVIEAALHAVEPEAGARQVRLIHHSLEDNVVWGGKMRLEQALINLVDNGVKFNHPGGSVRAESGRLDADRVYISVIDDGLGIPSEDLHRIFERFYRVDKARSREVGGTGLGLSIVKHVIERMNGTIRVESQLGKGSTFTVILPACATQE